MISLKCDRLDYLQVNTRLIMSTMQDALLKTLTPAVVLKAERAAKREGFGTQRDFDKAVAKGNANSLDRLRWLCEVANATPTGAKIATAEEALRQFVGKMTSPGTSASRHMTMDEFVLLSSFFVLCVTNSPDYSTPEIAWRHCLKLNEANGYEFQVTRWC